MIKPRVLDSDNLEGIVDIFERSTVDEIMHLFHRLDKDGKKAEDFGNAKDAARTLARISNFFDVLANVNTNLRQALRDELEKHLLEEQADLYQSNLDALKAESGIHPMFHEEIAKAILLNGQEVNTEFILDHLEQLALAISYQQPEQYRYSMQDVDPAIVEHFAWMETTINHVLNIMASVHLFKFDVIPSENKSLFVIRIMPIDDPNNPEKTIFDIVLKDECFLDTLHYLEDHQKIMNQILMLSIAELMED